MAVMRVKLLQDGCLLDSADRIERVDFSKLRGHSSWSMTINFGDGEVTIAEVDWRSATSYEIRTEGANCERQRECIVLHNHIVPIVLIRLLRLYVTEQLHWRQPTQPLVTVTPVIH